MGEETRESGNHFWKEGTVKPLGGNREMISALGEVQNNPSAVRAVRDETCPQGAASEGRQGLFREVPTGSKRDQLDHRC